MAQHHQLVSTACHSDTEVPLVGEPTSILSGLLEAKIGLIAISESCEISFVNSEFLTAAGAVGAEPISAIGQRFQDIFITYPLPTATAEMPPEQPGIGWSVNPTGGWVGVLGKAQTSAEQSALLFEPDELTGLGNRKHLKACFERMIQDATRQKDTIIALFLDLDHFKQVNDTLGHAIGDGLLCKVAERLKRTIRRDDVVARVGGDEFAILLVDHPTSGAEDVASRIIKMISRPFLIGGHQLTIGVSIGLAARLPEETDPEKVLQRADIALYESKREGRNRFRWFKDEMFIELEKRRDIEIDLRKAVLLQQFEIEFQPQMDFQQQRVNGFEALIRWNHPQRGKIAPVDFIGIAEDTGSIIDIGAWVMCEACKAAIAWPEHISVAVNVSSIQFEDDGFINAVKAALTASGLAPHRLELEITETALLKNEEVVLDRMNELRSLGIRISLDDFGIGYSSLNYLRKYPFDKVKIDQSFVREPFADENAHQIVEAVAQLGTAFGMKVLAEGVETSEQLARIRANGCGSIQGYFLGRPIKPTEIASFLTAPLPEIASQGPSSGKDGDKP